MLDSTQANTTEQVSQKLKQYVDMMVSDDKYAKMVYKVDGMKDVCMPTQLYLSNHELITCKQQLDNYLDN